MRERPISEKPRHPISEKPRHPISEKPRHPISEKPRPQYTRSFSPEKKPDTPVKTVKVKEPQHEWTRKIEPKAKQPFKPTAIPSPIYGFNNRPKKEKKTEVPEFELKGGMFEGYPFKKTDRIPIKESLVKQAPSTNKQVMVQEKESLKEEARPSPGVFEKTLPQNQTHESESKYGVEESSPFRGSFQPVEQQSHSRMEETPEKVMAIEVPKLDSGEQLKKEAASSTEQQVYAEKLREERKQNVPHDMSESIEEETMEAINADPPAEGINTPVHILPQAPQSRLGLDEKEDLPSEKDLTLEELQPIERKADPEAIQGSIADEAAEIEENVPDTLELDTRKEEEPAIKRRSHIPFNVIMLKQDKKKREHIQPNIPDTAVMKEEVSVTKETVLEQAVQTQAVEDYQLPQLSEVACEGTFVYPSIDLLTPPVSREMDEEWIREQSEVLDNTLINFNVRAKVVNVSQGPSVTRFEIQPEPGVKVNKITNLTDDIKLSLAARDIRIEAPIPGKHTVGIEIPNEQSRPVFLSEIIESPAFQESTSPLTAALGLDISGKPIITDLRKMPHGLIAGATGSGKSVCINSILVSLLYKASPRDLKLLLIDPKMVELAPYNHIPHLVSPVITDVKAATASLKWAVEEMERRYELFAHAGVRDITRFNEMAVKHRRFNEKLPFIVIIIDELADLMMMSPDDVETAICRIAQKARACGIHLIVATQRPSVDVITGLIKANIPTRTAFSVSSQIDSRTIIDMGGAEKLLGRGDMLFLENGSSKPQRLQGTFVSDEEIDLVVAHVRNQEKPNYLFEQEELLKKSQIQEEEDELFYDACEFVIDQGGASTSLLQRNFRVGYNRAARLIEMMESQGIISEPKGSKPRDILITMDEFLLIQDTNKES
nr:DNA translocase FtsK [Heyndrickxia acidicola]